MEQEVKKHFNTIGLKKLHDYKNKLNEYKFDELFGSDGTKLYIRYLEVYKGDFLSFIEGLDEERKEKFSRSSCTKHNHKLKRSKQNAKR